MPSLIAQEQLEPCRVALTISVGTDEIARAQETVFQRAARQTTIPGFRTGKAPHHLVRKYLDEARIAEMAVDQALNNAFRAAIKEADIHPYSEAEPKVDLPDDRDFAAGFQFVATIATQPKVELGSLEGLTAKRYVTQVEEDDVEKEIERVRQSLAEFREVEEPAAQGDRLRATVHAEVDGEYADDISFEEPALIQIGANLPVFDEQLVGIAPGDEKSFSFTFPDEFEDETRRGKTAECTVRGIAVLRNSPPELDDTLAQRLGLESVEVLRERVRTRLEAQAASTAEQDVNDSLIEEVVKRATVHFPSEMIDREASGQLRDLIADLESRNYSLEDYLAATRTDLTALQEQMRTQAEERVRTTLVLLELARSENLQLTEQDVEGELKARAEARGVKLNQYRRTARDNGEIAQIQNDLFFRKLLGFLREKAEITEVQA